MIGGGTTAIEAKILNRHITCVDVNEEALERTRKSLEFEVELVCLGGVWLHFRQMTQRKLRLVQVTILLVQVKDIFSYFPPIYLANLSKNLRHGDVSVEAVVTTFGSVAETVVSRLKFMAIKPRNFLLTSCLTK